MISNARGSGGMKGIALGVPIFVLAFALFAPAAAPVTNQHASTGAATQDFVTGGGWIWNNGEHLNFGFVAGYKSHQPLGGQLNYIDHGGDTHLKAETVDVYSGSGNSRTFSGRASINGVSGFAYECYVEDNGEPGIGVDYFRCSNLATEESVEGFLAGGNIQIHV